MHREAVDVEYQLGRRRKAVELARILCKSFGRRFNGRSTEKVNTSIYGCIGKRWMLNTNN
jgi:hypothetical protein